ncbi:MAG: stage II sporulation protein M [Methanosphaera sp.]|nr:stage II sporulation protein M [Methanosphaera sp.]
MRGDNSTKNLLSHMKYHLLLAAIIAGVFIILSYYYPSMFENLILFETNRSSASGSSTEFTFSYIFLKNMRVMLGIYLGGLVLSIPSLYLLILNNCYIGYNGFFIQFKFYFSYMIAHTPIEIVGLICATAGAFRITQTEYILLRSIRDKTLNLNKPALKGMMMDSIKIFLIGIVFMILAIYVELNLTIPFGNIMMQYF